ncbi:hypothetical protein V8C44DRAFT_243058 [Trichoderma aethiopicum]
MPQDMEDNGADVSDPVSENEEDSETLAKDDDERMADTMAANGSYDEKKKYDPKDPLRPRRKKARRACFACQRAHLTCGASCLLMKHDFYPPIPHLPLSQPGLLRVISSPGSNRPLLPT